MMKRNREEGDRMMEKLMISENQRYFETESGKPFIWIADTAWTIPQRMKWDDVSYYMKKRKSQGFTVLQIVALDPERDLEMRNPAGEKALIDDDLTKPNEQYFKYLDWIIDEAERNEMYVLLLPVWGQLVVGEDWGGNTYEKIVTAENAYQYGEWIGHRYAERKNILWCLGGDRQPIHKQKDDYRNVWRRMAEGLGKGVTGQNLKCNENHELWKKLLITYHACFEMETGECSTFSYWTDEEAWISFIMLQSGHGTTVKNYELIKKEYERELTMPVWDGEPAYEDMPTCWPITGEACFHKADIVRKRAYWSLLAGAFGYTYGHCNVWCSISEQERNFISKTDWFESLSSEGSKQIKYMHAAIESLQLYNSQPCQEILEEQQRKEDTLEEHVQAAITQNGTNLCIYFQKAGEETLDVDKFSEGQEEYFGWWYNPQNGKFYTTEMEETTKAIVYNGENHTLKVKTPEADKEQDWIFILRKEDSEVPVKVIENVEEVKNAEVKKVFEW